MFTRSALILFFCAALTLAAQQAAVTNSSPAQRSQAAPAQILDYSPETPGVTPPKLIHQVDPHYPRAFFGRTKSSDVQIQLLVGTDGLPTDLKVSKSGGERFDKSALAAVSQYRFRPAEKDGHPITMRLIIAVKFRFF